MPRTTADPIGCVPSSISVRKALVEARRQVSALEYLLEVAQEMETRLRGDKMANNGTREATATDGANLEV